MWKTLFFRVISTFFLWNILLITCGNLFLSFQLFSFPQFWGIILVISLVSGEMVVLECRYIWTNVLKEIKDELSSLAFTTWFNDVNLKQIKDGRAIVVVPMSIHKKHLADNYSEVIREALNKVTGTNFELEFLLPEELDEQTKKIEPIIEQGVPKEIQQKSNLNHNYTFENFIVGNSNLHKRLHYLLLKILVKCIIPFLFMEIVGQGRLI